MSADRSICPLCKTEETTLFHLTHSRDFLKCNQCQLVFVKPEQRISLEEERKLYTQHQNNTDDPDYRKFLKRIFTPVTSRILPLAKVLDFGCGPGPALSSMFSEAGYEVSIFDPYFFPNPEVLTEHYEIITCTEVIEHCHNPMKELLLLTSLLKPRGILGIMTKRLKQPDNFAEWHYKNDPTHVCFFADQSFQWIADKLQMQLAFCGDDSLILY